jgi:hypothetical protein
MATSAASLLVPISLWVGDSMIGMCSNDEEALRETGELPDLETFHILDHRMANPS